MTETANPLDTLRTLSSLLVSAGYESDRPAMITIDALRASLVGRGYKESPPSPAVSNYTLIRAQALRKLSGKLKTTLDRLSKSESSYSDKAVALSVVSNSYLQLAHAFKVDTKVWSFAQEDLVPILSAAVDEKTLDEAISRLLFHIDRYAGSLSKWLPGQ